MRGRGSFLNLFQNHTYVFLINRFSTKINRFLYLEFWREALLRALRFAVTHFFTKFQKTNKLAIFSLKVNFFTEFSCDRVLRSFFFVRAASDSSWIIESSSFFGACISNSFLHAVTVVARPPRIADRPFFEFKNNQVDLNRPCFYNPVLII